MKKCLQPKDIQMIINEIHKGWKWRHFLIGTTLGDYIFWFPKRVQTWLGYALWSTKGSLLGLSNSLFFSLFLWLILYFPFFIMSNEIILFKILYQHLNFIYFSLMKTKIVIFIQCGPCSIIGPKFSKFSLFETFYIAIGHLVLSHPYTLCTLVLKVFMVRISGQKNLFKHSLLVLELCFFKRQNFGLLSSTW